METKPIPPQIQSRLVWWNKSAVLLRISYVALTMLSIICSVIVGSSSAVAASNTSSSLTRFGFLAAWQVAILSMTAAVAVGMLTAFDIRGHADRQRKAWRKLDTATLRYAHEKNYTIRQLDAVYASCENMLSDDKEPTRQD